MCVGAYSRYAVVYTHPARTFGRHNNGAESFDASVVQTATRPNLTQKRWPGHISLGPPAPVRPTVVSSCRRCHAAPPPPVYVRARVIDTSKINRLSLYSISGRRGENIHGDNGDIWYGTMSAGF